MRLSEQVSKNFPSPTNSNPQKELLTAIERVIETARAFLTHTEVDARVTIPGLDDLAQAVYQFDVAAANLTATADPKPSITLQPACESCGAPSTHQRAVTSTFGDHTAFDGQWEYRCDECDKGWRRYDGRRVI